jgi:NADPH-dependent 2,4-dienoyl-CoA reductase/sulfur reductase-like enzyme
VNLSPSEGEDPRTGMKYKALSSEEIRAIIKDFVNATRRAQEAGFDAVEIQCGHTHLIAKFLSPFFNKRVDEYGGNFEKRANFACQIISGAKEVAGSDFPILVRINGDDGIEGGVSVEDAIAYTRLFEEWGIDAIDVTAGLGEFSSMTIQPCANINDLRIGLAESIKKRISVPIIATGKIVDPFMAENLVQAGTTDFVGLGRALLADPEWCNKAREGRASEITKCIYCNNCCKFFEGGNPFGERWVACTVNPMLLREGEVFPKPEARKKIMVVGGGLAGMESAATAAERGHNVVLYEGASELGGQWNIASRQEFKRHFSEVTERMRSRLLKAGVELHLNAQVNRELIVNVNPDIVILATGAKPLGLNVPGADGRNVVQAVDVIMGKDEVGERVVVIGARYVGLETAIQLAKQGKRIWLIDKDAIGGDLEHFTRLALRDELIEHGIPVFPNSEVLRITSSGVSLIHNKELFFIRSDSVVLAVGYKPENHLSEELKGIGPRVYLAGDCVKPRGAVEAVNEAAEIANRI